MLSTATGLLFHGQSDGLLVAHDATTGDVLWQFQTGAGADAPVSTYEVDGQQYVAILSGGNQFMGTAPGDNLWVLKVGGTVKPAPEPRRPGPMPLPSERKEIAVDAAVLAEYAGTYELMPGASIVISVENGQLMTTYPGAPQKLPLFAETPTIFFPKMPTNVELRFYKDDAGVIRLTFRQGGQEMRAPRR